MKIVIATSRAFHLVHLARELSFLGHDVTLIGYVPRWRMQQYGLGNCRYIDLFQSLLPRSALALQRRLKSVCSSQTLRIMAPCDRLIAVRMPACDVFIGLSGVIVEAFTAARDRFGATTLCERGSAHVITQAKLINTEGRRRVPEELVLRELAGYTSADVTVVPSHFAEGSFIAQGHPDERLFRNMYGVNTSRFPKSTPAKSRKTRCRALFVGNWSYQKGCDLLADALEQMPELEITHVGQPADVPFPISPRFHTVGYIDNARLSQIYREHDIFILPSRQDGFGMVLLEAFASGLPIVASRNTGAVDIRQVICHKNRVRIIDDYTSQALVEELRALHNELCFGKFAAVSDADIDSLTWSAYARRYDSFLSQFQDAKNAKRP